MSKHLESVLSESHVDLARSVYLEGITLELLSNEIRQFNNSFSTTSRRSTTLSTEDIQKVLEAKEAMLQNLQEPPTIDALSKKVGVNQTKLKIGFKTIFNMPIKTWLRYQKLEIAQMLLLKDGKSIREISEEVGYQNQSHFAKQFKARYGVLPKDYLQQIKKVRTVEL